MNKRILDTNVLIYGMDAQSRYHAAALSILTDPAYALSISTKVVAEFFAVCSKLKVSHADALKFFHEVKKNVDVLFPDAVSMGHFEQLIQKYQPVGNRVFDLEIVSVAMANSVPEIATANHSDFAGVTEIRVLPLMAK